ncbi:conserved Plasmodium protein, unknown function [Plasmodium berghei]|uniref:TMEM121 domain-containing protein, putative n=2 Tax=Plasmodium berghei TaxID=5821 RepID=A0A509ADJ2_PLABA|nr:TMEM121 domain-containing protein, putative [Plasmodium berghei ANKA]CXH96345.1 conserved Plasmodium protein, unknown function [Plasmodium berghei]SCL91135.1 conserved Plasmodium protein, unknown function [Plasmodium berghei]SCM15432.1 conserved Plasmodium protein, unknown function [Plasmodium berghei]SCM17228.1 conserved Plasmodium protein, unknown function [Plasmodium berghei]SCN22319.1 conserved Plasmodium protein, unknown function [Plasmodium berghei]|eukprot:XP_034420018.1 TMEM121 domain-containing protein, putative [Plasmodium berghei ANKA]
MIPKILDDWRISFFFNLTTFIIQQIWLYYILFHYNKLILLLCVFDIYIFIQLCFNNSQAFSAIKGGTCWLLYVYSIAIKVTFMYFFAFNDNDILENTAADYYNKSIVFILLSLSTLIYTALSVKSYKQLYPDENTISNEKFFHKDLILHVVIDLFDIFELLFTLLRLPHIIESTNFWIKIIGGVLISFSVYLNGYSFPIISIVAEKNSKNLDLGDIYFCKKHAAVIGIILIDIPFMILRFYLLVFYFSNIHFQPLLIKNICFIPIKCITIKRCNIIFKKLRKDIDYSDINSKINTRISVVNDTVPGVNDTNNNLKCNNLNNITNNNGVELENISENETTIGNMIGRNSKSIYLNNLVHRKKTPIMSMNDIIKNNVIDIQNGKLGRNEPNTLILGDNTNNSRINGNRVINFDDEDKQGKKTNKKIFFDDFNNDDNGLFNLKESFEKIVENSILDIRNINKNTIRKKYIMNKLMHINTSNNEKYHCYLDANLKVSYQNQLRLMIPYIIYCLGKIAMSLFIYFFYAKIDIYNLKLILTSNNIYSKLFENNNIIFLVALSIILGNSIISFFSFIFISSFFEVVFFVLFIFVKCFSDFLFLLLLAYTSIFEIFLRNINQSDKYAPYFFLSFSVIPSFKIIRNIYIFLCSLSGRQFIGYIIRPFTNDERKNKLQNFLNIREYHNISQNITTYLNSEFNFFSNNEINSKKKFKGDYKGFISIASLLIYINTKYMHGLCSVSTLMIGNNFIKNLRLNYNIRNAHFLLILSHFLIRFSLLLFIYINYKSNIISYKYTQYFYYGITAIFSLDIFLKYFYMVLSHNYRISTMHKLELKSIYEDIYYNSKTKKENSQNYFKNMYNKYQTNTFYYHNIPLFSEFA